VLGAEGWNPVAAIYNERGRETEREASMTARLPDELRTVLNTRPGEPLELIDDQNHRAYVLVDGDEFQRLKDAAANELGDTYAAQIESAMRAGWDDPRMDKYNDTTSG
jgi:bifunctional DNA-binding transcriptional regulator/antitoxin component of YhaV-PrlF toxin-antitoxin module